MPVDSPTIRTMVTSRKTLAASLRWLGPVVVCVVVPALLVISTIDRHPKFSPIDEGAHFDYVERIYDKGIPTFGDRLLRSSLREMACRGTRLEGLVVPPCDAKVMKYDLFLGGAYQYEAQQPPLYYALTAPIARIIKGVTGIGALGAARLVGVLWLTLGLLVLWRASRLLAVPQLPMLATILAIAAAPNVVYYSSIVSNDSAGILCGALAAYVAALTLTRHRPYTWPAIALGVAAALTKTSCALPVGVVGLVVAAASLSRHPGISSDRRGSLRRTGLGLISGSVVGTLAWVVYYRSVATIEPKTLPTFDVLRTGPVNLGNIFSQARSFLSVLTDSYNPFAVWNGEVYGVVGMFAMLAIVAGLAAGAFTPERTWWSIAGPIVLSCLYVGGVVIGIGIWRAYDINPGVSGRYALPMLPLIALVVPAALQRRTGRIIYSTGATVFAVLSLWMISHVSLA